MSALIPSGAGGGYGANLHRLVLPDVGCNGSSTTMVVSSEFLAPNVAAAATSGATKRKRRPAGTPDPGAEVVALSPKTLMESDRYVCEICNQGFQRDQNLQMHRRRHKVPWKLLKRPSSLQGTNKRVYICPERSCLHHDPAHALGDLVGIKKHYRRKHCTEKQWKCDKCSKGYAVQSDYKAHLKTCGTRGHCCDCGRVFSRVESFIEHQDSCSAVKHKAGTQSGGGSDSRAKSSSAPGLDHRTDRNSTGSPSQSSDTTQAMPFGMSDTADHTRVADEHSRRIGQQSQAVAATPSTTTTTAPPPMPAWMTTDHSRRNELELLPSSKHSKSQNLIRSSIGLIPHPDISCTESKSALLEPSRELPSLQLSMGPYNVELASGLSFLPYIDKKPNCSSSVETASVYERQTVSAGPNAFVPRAETTSRRSDLAPATTSLTQYTVTDKEIHILEGSRPEDGDPGDSLSGFLRQAAVRRQGPGRSQELEESNIGVNLGHQSSSTRKLDLQLERVNNHGTTHSTVANHKFSCAATGSTSSYHHEHLAADMHESGADAQGPLVRKGFTHSRALEPSVTRSAVSSRHPLFVDHKDGAESNRLFAAAANSRSADEAFRSQKHNIMAVGLAPRAEITTGACDSQMDTSAWSDLARVRRAKDEARQECDEAQRDIARAELLKREAREQLQFAAAERAYAESAREVAKRHVEISEAELARAKRLREHAQSELDKAGISSPPPAFCHSCKSALAPESNNYSPSRNKSAVVPTSPPASSVTWSFKAPATAEFTTPPDHHQPGTSDMNLWAGDRSNLWPAAYRSISSSPLSIAIGDSSPVLSASRRSTQSDEDHINIIITPKLDLDLN